MNNNAEHFGEKSRKELDSLAPRTKKGNNDDGTDAAHLLGFALAQSLHDNSVGRPITNENTMAALVGALNDDNNLRIKSQEGNRSIDKKNENDLIQCIENKESITSKDTAEFAAKAYKANKDSDNAQMECLVEKLGNMTFNDGSVGRPITIKSLAKDEPSNINQSSKNIKNNNTMLNKDGTVDKRCRDYKQGLTITKNDGTISASSKTVRNGDIILKSSSKSNESTKSTPMTKPTNNTPPTPTKSSSNSNGSSYSSSSYSNSNSGGKSYSSSSPSSSSSSSSGTYVSGYTRTNGTYVSGYMRGTK
jgi:hypothetical protein